MAELMDPEPLSADVQRAFEQIRKEHGLRELTDDEDGTGVDRLPGGVFGFTYSPCTENFPLFKDRDLRSYEGHKLPDGTVFLLGFLTPAEKETYDGATERVTLHLFPEPKDDADQLVSLPLRRIVSHVEYSQRSGNGLEIVVA